MTHVSDKAVRFVRAHLAQAIVDNSPLSREKCMQLVEHSLYLDEYLAKTYLPPQSVCAVLHDARTVHIQWVEADHHFFVSYLSHICSDNILVYSFRKSYGDSIKKGSQYRCYNVVYDCLYIFMIGE